jgi:hypothetical protein
MNATCLRAVSEGDPFEEFDDVMRTRRAETHTYYAQLQNDISDPDARLVQRQALAGVIWSKQYFTTTLRNGCMVIRNSRLPQASVYADEILNGSTSIMMM